MSFYILIYIGLFCVFYECHHIFIQNGIIGHKIDLYDQISTKAESLISQLEHKYLAINFLLNQRILSDEQKVSFQSSGLIHLLAVSGGQVLPVARIISLCVIEILYFLLAKHLCSATLMRTLLFIKHMIGILVALLMTGLFACAGALVRVIFFASMNEFLKSQKILYFISFYLPILSDHFVRRCVLLFLLSLLFGNAFFDYSFLLSSIGALSVEIIAFSLNFILKKIRVSFVLNKFINPILLTFFTSWFVAIILFPVTRVPIFQSGFSNVLASPIATFLITPLSLILIFFPESSWISKISLSGFDVSLGAIEFISDTFQDGTYSIQIPKILLFSYEGHLYLVIILIVLLSISDLIRCKDEFWLRNYLSKKNV